MVSSLAATTTKSGAHLLAEAVGRGDLLRVKTLLTSGANPNERTRSGLTMLMSAIINGHVDVAELLLEHGADVNARRDDGFTPLLFAAFFGQYDLVCLMLQRGADIKAQSRSETSAEMWASARGFPEVAALLRRFLLDESTAGSLRLQKSVNKPASTGITSPERLHRRSDRVRYTKFRKRTAPTSSGKRVAALTAAALFISGLCTYYAARTNSKGSDRIQDSNSHASSLSSAPSAGHLLAGDQVRQHVPLKDVAEFSQSLSNLLADKGKQQSGVRVPNLAADMRLPSKQAIQAANRRLSDSVKFGELSPSQSEHNNRMRQAGAPTPAGKAKLKKGQPDSSGPAAEELPEIDPATVMVEQKAPRSSTSEVWKTENGSPQSPSLPAATEPKHKVIRWP